MPGKPQPRDERSPIKINRETHVIAKRLLAQASRHGWASIGVDRDDPPSLISILEEAVKRFASAAQVTSRASTGRKADKDARK
jgi:hypothetical protein